MKKPKILFLDLENVARPEHIFHPGKRSKFGGRANGFCADLAYILVFGYKWYGEKPQSITLTREEWKKDRFDDTPILLKAKEIVDEADVVITWYGSGHDMPFLNSRLARIGKFVDPGTKHVDLYRVANSKLRLSSNRLDSAAKFFDLEQKMQISKLLWPDCWAGKYASLKEMAKYCEQDCEVLSNVYDKMLGLGISLPNIGKLIGNTDKLACPSCGHSALFNNGTRVTKEKRYHRLLCRHCGSSTKGKEIKDEK